MINFVDLFSQLPNGRIKSEHSKDEAIDETPLKSDILGKRFDTPIGDQIKVEPPDEFSVPVPSLPLSELSTSASIPLGTENNLCVSMTIGLGPERKNDPFASELMPGSLIYPELGGSDLFDQSNKSLPLIDKEQVNEFGLVRVKQEAIDTSADIENDYSLNDVTSTVSPLPKIVATTTLAHDNCDQISGGLSVKSMQTLRNAFQVDSTLNWNAQMTNTVSTSGSLDQMEHMEEPVYPTQEINFSSMTMSKDQTEIDIKPTISSFITKDIQKQEINKDEPISKLTSSINYRSIYLLIIFFQ